MKKTIIKNEKGITLIALVITIIVILILVGVAITMLSGENGILKQVANAKVETSNQSIIEQIKLGALAAITNENHKIESKASLELALKGQGLDNAIVDEVDEGYKVTVDNVTQIISNNGKIENNSGGESDTGDTSVDYRTYEIGDILYYNSNPDKDSINEKWIVYTKDDMGIEVISANTMGNLTLGVEDPYLPENVGDLDSDGTSGTDIDKAMWSYNNAIETINKYCDSIVTAEDNSGVRSIGATLAQDNAELFDGGYYYLGYFPSTSMISADTYAQTEENNLKNVGETDIRISEDINSYWIAARNITLDGAAHFEVWQMGQNGELEKKQLIYVGLAATTIGGYTTSCGVRPIIRFTFDN